MNQPRPRVLVALPGVFPSTIINVARPLLRLHQAGAIDLDLSFHFVLRRRQIARADVLVMSHTIDPAYTWILDCAREAGTPLVYDIDENLLEPPAGVHGLDFHRDPGRQAAVRQALSQATVVRTYAPALERYLRSFNANVVRTDGPVEWRLVPSELPARDGNRVHLVYATSRLQDSIGAVLVAPLRHALDEHPNVDVTIWGPRFPELDGHPRVRFREFVRDYDRYFGQFARAGFDIGLAPMPQDVFYQCKTATKFREYAACGIAGIYADTEMYRDCVSDGLTGLLAADGDDAWVGAMRRLIRDEALRRQIQQRARTYAQQRYATNRIEGDWLAHIDDARRRRPSAAVAPASDRSGQAMAGGVAGQVMRYVARASRLLRSAGAKELWTRICRQLANVRQLAAWELALRRMPRQPNRQ